MGLAWWNPFTWGKKANPTEEIIKQSYCTAWQLQGDDGCDKVAFKGNALCLGMASTAIKTCQDMYTKYYQLSLLHKLDCQKNKKENNESCDVNSSK